MNIRISRTEQWEYTASANGVQGTGGSPEGAELNLLRKIVETQTTCTLEQKKFLNDLQQNFKWEPHSGGTLTTKLFGRHSQLFQLDFSANLKDVV